MVSLSNALIALADDPDFKKLSAEQSSFNLFEALGVVRAEVRHSNFLAFLLDPNQSHNLGSNFLAPFIRSVLTAAPAPQGVDALEVILADLRNTTVHREQGNIDVLIEARALDLVIAIENKIDARESTGQLQRYADFIRNNYPRPTRHLFVYLTPNGERPSCADWIPFSYSQLYVELETNAQPHMAADVAMVIQHYISMMKRHVVTDSKLKELAIQLYQKHRTAFEFVMEHAPRQNPLVSMGRSIVEEREDLIIDSEANNILRFIPRAWDGVPELAKCPQQLWTHTGRHLLFELKSYAANPDLLTLALVIGPTEDERYRVPFHALAASQKFKGMTTTLGQKFCTLFSAQLIAAKMSATLSDDAKRQVIENNWHAFATTDLPRITQSFLDLARETHGSEATSVLV
jgi:hypothetical protein